MNTEKTAEDASELAQAIAVAGEGTDFALQNAIHLWAVATTDAESHCRQDLLRAKKEAAASFFRYSALHPAEVKPSDVERWRAHLEERRFKPATVYARISRLSSFYEWVMKEPTLGQYITSNPARLAMPKCPKPYQTESTKALDDEQMTALIHLVRKKAEAGEVTGKRDYALLLFFITTGMRRREVIGLRGSDLELRKDDLVVRCRVKGGDYVGRAVSDPSVRTALLDYLTACGRANALGSERPLWTRHDRAGKPGAPLSSHAFDKNLKRYARETGIGKVHIHQTRHTFARIISEETGSIVETQDALGHKNLATTRVYVGRIAVKGDKYGRRIIERLKISESGQNKAEGSPGVRLLDRE
jgi:site-specific recombinase XerD